MRKGSCPLLYSILLRKVLPAAVDLISRITTPVVGHGQQQLTRADAARFFGLSFCPVVSLPRRWKRISSDFPRGASLLLPVSAFPVALPPNRSDSGRLAWQCYVLPDPGSHHCSFRNLYVWDGKLYYLIPKGADLLTVYCVLSGAE